MPAWIHAKNKKAPKVAEQPYAPIPSLPGAFGKADKKKGKKTGGMTVR